MTKKKHSADRINNFVSNIERIFLSKIHGFKQYKLQSIKKKRLY